MRVLNPVFLLSLMVVACGAGESDSSIDASAVDGSGTDEVQAGRCVTPQWEQGATYFEERTDEWGLVDLGVQGVRMNVVDVDADGWPDVLVRRGGTRVGVKGAECGPGLV